MLSPEAICCLVQWGFCPVPCCLLKGNWRLADHPGTTPIQDPGTFGRPPTVVSSKPPSISALVCLPWLGVGRPTENQNSRKHQPDGKQRNPARSFAVL